LEAGEGYDSAMTARIRNAWEKFCNYLT